MARRSGAGPGLAAGMAAGGGSRTPGPGPDGLDQPLSHRPAAGFPVARATEVKRRTPSHFRPLSAGESAAGSEASAPDRQTQPYRVRRTRSPARSRLTPRALPDSEVGEVGAFLTFVQLHKRRITRPT